MNEKFSNTCKVYNVTFLLTDFNYIYPINMQRKLKEKRDNSFFFISCFIVDDLFGWIKMSFHFS